MKAIVFIALCVILLALAVHLWGSDWLSGLLEAVYDWFAGITGISL